MAIAKRKNELKEGSIFCVPLFGGGYCVGLVARFSVRQGRMLSYFFEPALESISLKEAMKAISIENTLDVMDSGIQSIDSGDWPILGLLPGFSRTEWPVPIFRARDGSCTRYDQDDHTIPIEVFRGTGEEETYSDSTYGDKAVQIILSKKLEQ